MTCGLWHLACLAKPRNQRRSWLLCNQRIQWKGSRNAVCTCDLGKVWGLKRVKETTWLSPCTYRS